MKTIFKLSYINCRLIRPFINNENTLFLMKGSPEPPQGHVQQQEGGENRKGYN